MDTITADLVADAESARSGRVEVLSRAERRRSWTLEQKREIVSESLGPELTPSEVARKRGISTGQIYTDLEFVNLDPVGEIIRARQPLLIAVYPLRPSGGPGEEGMDRDIGAPDAVELAPCRGSRWKPGQRRPDLAPRGLRPPTLAAAAATAGAPVASGPKPHTGPEHVRAAAELDARPLQSRPDALLVGRAHEPGALQRVDGLRGHTSEGCEPFLRPPEELSGNSSAVGVERHSGGHQGKAEMPDVSGPAATRKGGQCVIGCDRGLLSPGSQRSVPAVMSAGETSATVRSPPGLLRSKCSPPA
jgi:hypothetical protein